MAGTVNTGAWLIPAALGAAGAAGVLRSRYERNHFVVEQTELSSPKLKREWTFVFLSDLHDKEFGDGNCRLLAAVRAAAPDAVLIGGDTMIAREDRADLSATRRLLEGLRQLKPSDSRGEYAQPCPVYYGNGNHEQRLGRETGRYGNLYERFRAMLQELGIVYLPNRSVCVGDDIRISGLDLEECHYRNLIPAKLTKSDIRRRLGQPQKDRFQILLAHSPLFFDAYGGWGADLTLAGHFHGGTIRIPGLGGVMTPQYQFFLPWCAGTFQKNGRSMIVSRGIGTHSVNIRLWNKPQLVVVRLKPQSTF